MMVWMVVMVVMDYQVLLVLQGEMVKMAKWGNLVSWVPLDPRDPLAPSMEDWSTLSGGGPPALPPQEFNWCTVEELLAVATTTKEVDQIFSASQMILSTVTISLECREAAISMVWSICHPLASLLVMLNITTCHVLCAVVIGQRFS